MLTECNATLPPVVGRGCLRQILRRILIVEPKRLHHGCYLSRPAVGMQVFRTEIISRRLNKSATLPLMSAALTTVAGIMAIAAACTHPKVMHLSYTLHPAVICPVLMASWDSHLLYAALSVLSHWHTWLACHQLPAMLRVLIRTQSGAAFTLSPRWVFGKASHHCCRKWSI